VLFGLNRWPLVAIGFIFAFVAMAMSTLQGFERVPVALRRTARAMRLSTAQEMVHVVLPSCAPFLFTGLKLSIVYSFIGVIAGEFVLSGAGFGFDIAFAYNSFDNATMYGLMVLLLGFVGGLNMLLYSWERRMYLRRGGR
jgi:NitT/TauT family transport system permease protein